MKYYKDLKALLFTIEGFDRTGKRTLLKNLKKKFNDDSIYVYTVPKDYNKPDFRNKKEYARYLKDTTKKQMEILKGLSYKYDVIIQKDLLVSDMVFSAQFNRQETVKDYIDMLKDHFTIINIITLFNSYPDYVKRINRINDEVKYNLLDFKLVSLKFKNIAKKCFDEYGELYHFHLQKYFMSPNSIANDIIEYINSMKYILFNRNRD